MTAPWLYVGSPDPLESGLVTVLEGSYFCISDRAGNIVGHRADSLFVRDTRVLARWQLTIAGQTPEPLTVNRPSPFTATFVGLVYRLTEEALDHDLLVVRRRYVGNGMREQFWVHNPGPDPVDVEVDLRVGADFADLFEVKDGRANGAAAHGGDDQNGQLVVATDREGGTLAVTVGPEPAAEVATGDCGGRHGCPPRHLDR